MSYVNSSDAWAWKLWLHTRSFHCDRLRSINESLTQWKDLVHSHCKVRGQRMKGTVMVHAPKDCGNLSRSKVQVPGEPHRPCFQMPSASASYLGAAASCNSAPPSLTAACAWQNLHLLSLAWLQPWWACGSSCVPCHQLPAQLRFIRLLVSLVPHICVQTRNM